jgi:amino acid transporter
VERTTAQALTERAKLRKSLRRFDLIFFLVCTIVGLDTLGQVSSCGAQTFTWLLVLAVAFLLPYALLMAELGSAFPQEGGPYEWMKLMLGRFWAGVGAVLYWITNPLWVGGSLCFIATAAWNTNLHGIGTRTPGDYLFKLLFIWITVSVAIVSLRYGKWIPNVGAFVRVGVLAFFSLTVVVYAVEHGVHGYGAGSFSPTAAVFIGVVPLLLFNYFGFELQNGAGEEMVDPQRDVPVAVMRSGIVAVVAYAIPIFGILVVLPASKVTGISGFLAAVHTTFTVYGGAQSALLDMMAIGFVFALITSGATWLIGADRVQAAAAYEGGFPGWFGVFNTRLGTPVRVNVLSGVAASFFMLAGQHYGAGTNATFVVVLYMSISTTLISYLLIFPAIITLRYTHPDVRRPYRVPGGNAGAWVVGVVCTGWALLGSWVAVFPDTLEKLFGAGYNFRQAWGVSRMRFETFTLGTFAVIVVVAVVGYVLGKPTRDRTVDLPPAVMPAGD